MVAADPVSTSEPPVPKKRKGIRSLSQVKGSLTFKDTKTDEPRVANIPEQTLAKLQGHRKRQDEFRMQFGPDHRSDLDLIFANPDGSPLKSDSISATVSALFKRPKIAQPRGGALHLLAHAGVADAG